MLDVFLKFEKAQIINDKGNYHLLVNNASNKERKAISSRIDVENSGRWIALNDSKINGMKIRLGAIDQSFAENITIHLIKGKFPTKPGEMMIEQWAAESMNVHVNDEIQLTLPDQTQKKYTISGISNDKSGTKASGTPAVYLSVDETKTMAGQMGNLFLVEFKEKVNVHEAVEDIKSNLNITHDRIGLNNRLLAVIGQGKGRSVTGLYATGAVLFSIVLVAGVLMIYNMFNISVMDRVHRFGLLRCVGASQKQIKKLVKREGIMITLKAIPIGVVSGMLLTFICSVILKYYNQKIFSEIPLFSVSITGIGAGIIIGFLTVYIASLLPARKAAQVSPVNAVTGSSEIKVKKTTKRGSLTKIFRIEKAIGITNALTKKKTLVLMSSSIAISIIMFLGFQVFIDFMYSALKTTKPYTPDISLTSKHGMSESLYKKLSNIEGAEKVYGRMYGKVDATFDANRLTDDYKKRMRQIEVENNGLFIPPQSSLLISYDKSQLQWAKQDLIAGELSESELNAQNGVVAIVDKSQSTNGTQLQLGDKIYIQTDDGTKQLSVMALLRHVPFKIPKEEHLATFITTEKLFMKLNGKSTFTDIDIQLANKHEEQTVNEIKAMLNPSITFLDARQRNAEIDQTFLTMAIFVYGFVAVIALISVLNIINTLHTSVVSKIRYFGLMRAIGMSNAQLQKMVLAEAATYSLIGSSIGCIFGVALQKVLITQLLSSLRLTWEFPLMQVVFILMITLTVTILATVRPIKQIKEKDISEVVHSL